MSVFLYFVSFFFSLLFFDKNIVNREYKDYNIYSDTLLSPKAKHREQSKLIYQLLSKYHYKKIDVDDSLSVRILEKYIESLDPNREYFYKSDIDYFNQYKMQMDDYIISGYLEPAYEIFTVYHQRVKDRISFVFSMLENEPDFSREGFLPSSSRIARCPWPAAKDIADAPNLFSTAGSAPASNNILTISTWPSCTA